MSEEVSAETEVPEPEGSVALDEYYDRQRYKDFVSFEVPKWAYKNGFPPEELKLKGSLLEKVKRALEEIASTEEGFERLKQVAEMAPDGKINIIFNKNGLSQQFPPNDIAIGTVDQPLQYFSPETGGYHNLSVQRLLEHEICHHILGHTPLSFATPDKVVKAEAEAVECANPRTAKHWGEPFRDKDTTNFKEETLKGTPEWDLNKNFRKDGYSEPAYDPENADSSGIKTDVTLQEDFTAAVTAVERAPAVKSVQEVAVERNVAGAAPGFDGPPV